MSTPTLSVTIDTSEPRLQRDQIVTLVDGRHWDTILSTAFVDAITRTGMLTPLYKTDLWKTTTSGLYARLGKKDYTFDTPPFVGEGTPPPYPPGTPTDPSKWVEDPVEVAGNIYLTAQGVNDRAMTNNTWPRNRAFLLSWFAYNSGQTREVQIECGWLSDNTFIGLRIWTDGKAEIYKNGVQVGEGNIFERQVTSQTVYGKEHSTTNFKAKSSKGDSRQMNGEFVDLMLIPCRRRDLLLLSNKGGGFRFTFQDLDADNPDNEITPDSCRFFWQVPTGQAKVLLAPLNYQTSGNLISMPRTTRLAPGSSETPSISVYVDQPGFGSGSWTGSLLEADASGPFSPDGTKNRVRVQAALTGDGTSTPWVYGTSALFDRITVPTDSSHATSLTRYILSNTLSVPESPSDVSFKVTCKAPAQIEADGAAYIRTVGNRPVECAMSDGALSISFLTGRSNAPSWKEAINDTARELMLEFRDRCEAMEEYRFKESLPYDGLELASALSLIAQMPGYPSTDILIPAFGFNLPTVGEASQGEWALLPEIGDKALDWFTKLWETFARHTQWGWTPTASGTKLIVAALDDLEAGPVQTVLYPTIQDAIDNGIDPQFAPYYVYRSLAPTPIKCEANDIWVTGRDPRTGLPFQVHYADVASQDPQLAPALRPLNWLGEPREYAWVDRAITTKDAANWAAWTMARRLTPFRNVVPFEAFFQIRPDGAPVWRGDVVTLYGVGDVRITAFSGSFAQEFAGKSPQDDRLWRPFHYTGEVIYGSGI